MGEPDAAWRETIEHPRGCVNGIVELAPGICHVAADDHEAVIRLDQYRLMPGRVPRSWHDPDSREQLLFALELHIASPVEVHPLRDRVVLSSSCLALEPLHVNGDSRKQSVATAVVEMQVRVDHEHDVPRDELRIEAR